MIISADFPVKIGLCFLKFIWWVKIAVLLKSDRVVERTRCESTNSHEAELNEVRALIGKMGVMEIMDEGRPVSKRVKEGEDMNDFTNSVVGLARLTHHEP